MSKGREYSSEILRRAFKRDQDPGLWAWLEIFSPSPRGTNSKTAVLFISCDIFSAQYPKIDYKNAKEILAKTEIFT